MFYYQYISNWIYKTIIHYYKKISFGCLLIIAFIMIHFFSFALNKIIESDLPEISYHIPINYQRQYRLSKTWLNYLQLTSLNQLFKYQQ